MAVSFVSLKTDTEVLARRYLNAMHQPDCFVGGVILGHVDKTVTLALPCVFVYHSVDGRDSAKG